MRKVDLLPFEDASFRRQYAEMWRQIVVTNFEADGEMLTIRQRLEAEHGIRVAEPEEFVPPVIEILSIGAEPFCRHGDTPLMRCKECFCDALMAASMQALTRVAFGHDLPDEVADEWVTRMHTERQG